MATKQKYKTGKIFICNNPLTSLRIMAYAEGYYMARFKGAMPFVIDEKGLESKVAGLSGFPQYFGEDIPNLHLR